MTTNKLKIILATILTLIYTTKMSANDFVKFDPSQYAISTYLPTLDTLFYTQEGQTPQINLFYPEYRELNKEEIRSIEKYGHKLAETPLIQVESGSSRGSSLINVSITPFIKKAKKYYRLVSAKIIATVPVLNSYNARPFPAVRLTANERYAQTSVLSSGKWVKIRVPDTGIYQITSKELASYGFRDLSKIRIYGYGGNLQNKIINYTPPHGDIDDLEEVPAFNTGNKLLFLAKGPYHWSGFTFHSRHQYYLSTRIQNPYSTHGYYFITEGEPMKFPIASANATNVTNVLTTFPEHAHYEQDAFAWLQSGNKLYDAHDFATGANKTFTIATPDAVGGKSLITLSHTAASKNNTQTEVSLDGTSLGRFSISPLYDEYYAAQVGTATYATTATLASASKVALKMPVGIPAHLDYITINYERQLSLNTHSSLLFSHHSLDPAEFHITGGDANTQVWRIGRGAGDPTTRINTSLLGNTLSALVDDPSREYVALNPAASFPTPEFVGTIENQDLHAHTAADMIIIVPENPWMLSQAERLAELHRKQDNLRVRIVRADQLYNEFSSGTPDPMAYRRYLKMLYDRAESSVDMPKYLLLFGPSLWDNRLLTSNNKSLSAKDYLLCYESDNSTHKVNSYVSDDFFGFLDDGEGEVRSSKLDIAIGRISPKNLDEATTAVDKIIAYTQNSQVGAWKNRIIMMADDGDNNRHMSDAEIVASEANARNGSYLIDKVFWDAYTLQSTATGNRYPEISSYLRTAIKNGGLIMNYTGHGSPSLVSHEHVLTIRDFQSGGQGRLPYWAFAACEVTPFDGTTDYISAAALFNKSGGAVAVYGATRDVYASQNFALNRQMMRHLLTKDSIGRSTPIGEAIRLAKNAMSSEDNKLKYVLFGDPALRLTSPSQRIIIDSVNGAAVSTTPLQLKAGSVLTLTGYVANYADSVMLSDFTGSITASLYDRMQTITGRKNIASTTSPFVFQAYKDVLFEGNDSVKNGRFTLSIPIPMDISYTTDLGKLFLYAVNTQNTKEAHGDWHNFYLSGTDNTAVNDSMGPKVKLYLDRPNFTNGGYTGISPQLIARISDSTGINTTGIGIGHDIELVVDNDATKTYILNDYFTYDFGSYTSGQVAFTLPPLPAGPHQLRFRVWDLQNNPTTQYVDFVVDASAAANTTLTVSPNPASTSTEMFVRYPASEQNTTIKLQVFDVAGRLYMEHSATAAAGTTSYTYKWGLTTSGGAFLPSGVYLCRTSVTNSTGQQYATTQKLIISR